MLACEREGSKRITWVRIAKMASWRKNQYGNSKESGDMAKQVVHAVMRFGLFMRIDVNHLPVGWVNNHKFVL